MQAILLAGGLGTRLRSVVSDRPKPMADVCGEPFLAYLIRELKRNGITDLIMAVGYLGEMIEAYFGNGESMGIHIAYSYEKEQLGTAGAIKNAAQYVRGDSFLVLNADTFYQAAYGELIELYEAEQPDMALVLRKVPDISRYGAVRLEGNKVTAFNEKRSEPVPGLINGGIYLMSRNVLNRIPEGKKCSLENEIIPALLGEDQTICATVNEGYFIDIGVPEDYYRFIQKVDEKEI